MVSRYAATDDLLDAPPTATEGFLPDFAAIEGRWVNAAIATEGFLCEPIVALMCTADDVFLVIIAVEDRFFASSPEEGRPCKKSKKKRKKKRKNGIYSSGVRGAEIGTSVSDCCLGAKP